VIELSPIGRELLSAGRNSGPAILFDWWFSKRLTVDELRELIVYAWEMAEFPARNLGIRTWVELFRAAGPVNERGEPIQPPPEGLTAWRGAPWGQRRGMSWTLDVERAAWFANRSVTWGRPAHVFQACVAPTAVLATNLGVEGRREDEVIVDPSMLPSLGRASIVQMA
jgi:hypothetical protein